jgi:hypothetical protein
MKRVNSNDIFKEEDCDIVGDKLKAIMIKLFVNNNITFGEFSRRHHAYAVASGMPTKQIASSRNNLIKVITCKDTLTYSRFEMIVKNILGLNLVSVSMVFKDPELNTQEIKIESITY